MARLGKARRLDVYVEPTGTPSRDEVTEALYALQVLTNEEQIREIAASPFAAVLVSVVKHLAQRGGSYSVVDLDAPSHLEQPEDDPGGPQVGRPRIEDVTPGG